MNRLPVRSSNHHLKQLLRLVLMSAFFNFFVTCENKLPHNSPTVRSGHIDSYPGFISTHVPSRDVAIWLPEDYPTQAPYQVLYMHDGQMLFDSTTTWNGQEWGIDETLSHLIRNGDVPPTIVVGISNTQNRHSEYFPQKPFESQTKARQDSLIAHAKRGQNSLFASPIYSDRYLSFLVDELKPFVDERYATETTPEHTFIGGSSMGGLISLYALTEYPEVFGGAACLSTHWIGTFESTANTFPGLYLRYLEEHLPKPETHKMYFDYGTVGLDSLYEPYQLKVDELMNKLGYDDRNWLSRKFEGADHSERSWKARLSTPLKFLLN